MIMNSTFICSFSLTSPKFRFQTTCEKKLIVPFAVITHFHWDLGSQAYRDYVNKGQFLST